MTNSTGNRTADELRAELDFRTLSWSQPSLILRDWALACLRGLDGEETTPEWELVRLEPYLPDPPASAEVQSNRGRRALRRLRLKAVSELAQPLARVLGQRLPPAGWRRWLSWRRPAIQTVHRLPAPLWPLVAEMAWSGPTVTQEVANTILGYLHPRKLMLDGTRPVPQIRCQSWWLLLDLIATPRLVDAVGWWYESWARRLALRVSVLAREQYQSGGWAGFWDQWLIRELARRHWENGGRVGEHARCVLEQLPWKNSAAGMLSEDAELPAVVDPVWRAQAPSWLLADSP